MKDLDPKFSFESFVIGPANRLASAAARRAAESPGFHHNPLFIHAQPGMGKTHLLGAVFKRLARSHPSMVVEYRGAAELIDEVKKAKSKKALAALHTRYQNLDVLLLDDAHLLAGQDQAQAVLLGALESLGVEGKQVVLASDRPPSEIEDLEEELQNRFEGGFLVDIGPPEYETKVAILREVAGSSGRSLDPRVTDKVARVGFPSVRALLEAMGGILVIQERENRSITPDEVGAALTDVGGDDPGAGGSELGQFLEEIADSVAEKVEAQEAPWYRVLREAAEEAEADGFQAGGLRQVMEKEGPPGDVNGLVVEFRQTLGRLRTIKEALDAVGNPWPEAAHSVLRDPDRLEEAEALLASANERARFFPAIPEGPCLQELGGAFPQLVVRAAEQLVRTERPEYNPLFVWSPQGQAALALLQAAGRTGQRDEEGARVALISVSDLANEFQKSLSSGVAGAWRERWWSADILLIQDAQDLAANEKVQVEFFQLLDALHRRKARIMLASDRPPTEMSNLDERLESRLSQGLVLELPVKPEDLAPLLTMPPPARAKQPARAEPAAEAVSAVDWEWIQSFGAGPQPKDVSEGGTEGPGDEDAADKGMPGPQEVGAALGDTEGLPHIGAFLSPERVIWNWPRLDERIVEASN